MKFRLKGLTGERGIAQIPLIVGLLLMAVAIPVVTRLAQQEQDTRQLAAVAPSCSGVSAGSSCGSYTAACCGSQMFACAGGTWTSVQNCSLGCKADRSGCVSSCTYGILYDTCGACGSGCPAGQKRCKVRKSDCSEPYECISFVSQCPQPTASPRPTSPPSGDCGQVDGAYRSNGANWCSGSTQKSCAGGNVYSNNCAYGCTGNGVCNPQPTTPPAQQICTPNSQLRCVWVSGSSRHEQQRCNSAGTGWNFVQTCAGGCSGNLCAAVATNTPVPQCTGGSICKSGTSCASHNMDPGSGSCGAGNVCCKAKPPTATPIQRYRCTQTNTCVADPYGSFSTLSGCQAACTGTSPVPTSSLPTPAVREKPAGFTYNYLNDFTRLISFLKVSEVYAADVGLARICGSKERTIYPNVCNYVREDGQYRSWDCSAFDSNCGTSSSGCRNSGINFPCSPVDFCCNGLYMQEILDGVCECKSVSTWPECTFYESRSTICWDGDVYKCNYKSTGDNRYVWEKEEDCSGQCTQFIDGGAMCSETCSDIVKGDLRGFCASGSIFDLSFCGEDYSIATFSHGCSGDTPQCCMPKILDGDYCLISVNCRSGVCQNFRCVPACAAANVCKSSTKPSCCPGTHEFPVSGSVCPSGVMCVGDCTAGGTRCYLTSGTSSPCSGCCNGYFQVSGSYFCNPDDVPATPICAAANGCKSSTKACCPSTHEFPVSGSVCPSGVMCVSDSQPVPNSNCSAYLNTECRFYCPAALTNPSIYGHTCAINSLVGGVCCPIDPLNCSSLGDRGVGCSCITTSQCNKDSQCVGGKCTLLKNGCNIGDPCNSSTPSGYSLGGRYGYLGICQYKTITEDVRDGYCWSSEASCRFINGSFSVGQKVCGSGTDQNCPSGKICTCKSDGTWQKEDCTNCVNGECISTSKCLSYLNGSTLECSAAPIGRQCIVVGGNPQYCYPYNDAGACMCQDKPGVIPIPACGNEGQSCCPPNPPMSYNNYCNGSLICDGSDNKCKKTLSEPTSAITNPVCPNGTCAPNCENLNKVQSGWCSESNQIKCCIEPTSTITNPVCPNGTCKPSCGTGEVQSGWCYQSGGIKCCNPVTAPSPNNPPYNPVATPVPSTGPVPTVAPVTPVPTSTDAPPPAPTNPPGPPPASCSYTSLQARVQMDSTVDWQTQLTIQKGEKVNLGCMADGSGQLANNVKIVVGIGDETTEFIDNLVEQWEAPKNGNYTIWCVSTDSNCGNLPSNSNATLSVGSACKECPNDFHCYGPTTANAIAGWNYAWFATGYVMEGYETQVPDNFCVDYAGLAKPQWIGKVMGDANCDGKLDLGDVAVWRYEFADISKGEKIVRDNWEADFTGVEGKCDGVVDIGDYSLWRANFTRYYANN